MVKHPFTWQFFGNLEAHQTVEGGGGSSHIALWYCPPPGRLSPNELHEALTKQQGPPKKGRLCRF